ncbi:LysR family transcriptional regulator [Bradyrhizobium sp. STM 3557]|uniref:helix-turn-helix domain-containing protein n=1 Tax=Bradyrhizobium sp. STM 3557 TaxID=578920 RepID=UPI0038906899
MRASGLHAGGRRCHVTQPSLTRAIQLLEKKFGGHLFRRARSRIHITEVGRIVQPLSTRPDTRVPPELFAVVSRADDDRASGAP